MVGSSFSSFLAFLLKGLYGGKNLETLVHGAVIAGSVGLVVFGLSGLRGAAREVRRRRRIAEDFGVTRFLVAPRWVDTPSRWPWRSAPSSSGRS